MTPPIKVKICGIREPEAMIAAVEAGADWVGLNFFPRSPRFVTLAQAARLASLSGSAGVGVVGLFVSPTDDEIADVLRDVPLDILQIYAAPQRVREIRQRVGLPVWHACGVTGADDLPKTAYVDGFIIEPAAPSGADMPGGNALKLDATFLANWKSPAPWLLAGGLTPDNVAEAITVSGAPAVDVSSGVEHVRGHKDSLLIQKFVRAAKASCHPART